MISMAKHRMNGVFFFFFACLLFAQVLYSEQPKDINYVLLFHVGSLAIFLYYGLCKTMMNPNRFPIDRLNVIALLFLVYFYTVGVFISRINGVNWLGSVEFPYRIANLLIMLFIPLFVRREKDLSQCFAAILVMMALQIGHDIFLGEETLFESRLWGRDFPSIMFLGSLPFAFGGLLLYWNAKTWRLFKRILLLVLSFLVLLKIFLSFSRTVWLVLFPLNVVGVLYLINYKSRSKGKMRRWYSRVTKLICSLMVICAIVSFGIVLYNPPTADLILSRYDKTGSQADNRTTELKMAYDQWLKSPIWGHGFGFETLIYKGTRFREQEYVHNFILQCLVSSGIIGLGLVLTLLGATFIQLRRLFKQSRSLIQTSILIPSLLTLFNIGLIGLVQTVILKEETYFFLGIIISFIVIIKRLQREEKLRAISITRFNEAQIPEWDRGVPVGARQPLRAR